MTTHESASEVPGRHVWTHSAHPLEPSPPHPAAGDDKTPWGGPSYSGEVEPTAGPHFELDGQRVPFRPGQTLIAAAARAGIDIPHLCWHPALGPSGACRVCTVRVDGRLAAACTTRAAAGQRVDHRDPALDSTRRGLVQMLFAEGRHFCPGCERSGDCRLQDAAYALDMRDPGFEAFDDDRPVDASHPDVWLDLNRCILCKLCVRASREVDDKGVFAIGGHGISTHLVVDAPSRRLGDTALSLDDMAAHICPVGAILPKRRGFAVPIGERPADRRARGDPPSGSQVPGGLACGSPAYEGSRDGAG
ncbi:MAG: 2Fe-2S iron-sulfur cluster-binding protein [Rubrivivax sp.]